MGSAKIYYDSDANPEDIKGKTIVFFGFGNQGAAQAQNLRDSGIPNDNIIIANREDSYVADAKSKGFTVEHDFAKAASLADIIFLLVPDQVQPRLFNELAAPKLKADATIVVASGYNVYFKLLNFKPTQDVVMVAPRMIGSSVRSLYEKGKGFPCFVSVEQDGSGSALKTALALSRAIGATKTGAIESSVKEETAMDLFAEQGLWPNIIMLFREAFSVLKEIGCSDEALCYEMWMSKEPAEIFEAAAEEGFITQLKHHSSVSQYGQLAGALKLDGSTARAHFKDILHNQVLNGKFQKEFSAIEADLEKEGSENPLNQLYEKHYASELGEAEKRVRARLAEALKQ
ncbi:IlvN-domain-containing protein [Flagelloscypha sp. PMI_526]|nr:IlvN-domain-containing protein [Flagelloscypha sp. PMI_526]